MNTTFIKVLYKDGEDITREQDVEVINIDDFSLEATIESNKLTLGTKTINAYCIDPVVKRVIQDKRIHFVRDVENADIILTPKTKKRKLFMECNCYVYVTYLDKYLVYGKAKETYMSIVDKADVRKSFGLKCTNDNLKPTFFLTRNSIRNIKAFKNFDFGMIEVYKTDNIYDMLYKDKPTPTLDNVKSMYEIISSGDEKLISRLVDNYNMCGENVWAAKLLCMKIKKGNVNRNINNRYIHIPGKISDILEFCTGSNFWTYNYDDDFERLMQFKYPREHRIEIENFLK